MAKYYLNAMLNDKVFLTITSGKLNEIDKFIMDNNIQNVEQLYNYIKDSVPEGLNRDCIEFVIQYKYKGEVKQKQLLFKNELMNFRKCNNKSLYIYELLYKDKNFKNKFDSKYINRILIIRNEASILTYTRDYIQNFNFDTFDRLYYSLISRKKDIDLSNKTFENSEELEYALNQRKYSYTTERDMYFDAYFWGKKLPVSKIIVNTFIKEDEFDEEMLYDQNPDTYRLYGKKIEDIESEEILEIEKLKKNNVKKKEKKLIFENPKQLSFFDD